jgi:anti-sigma B factor antagonist
VTGSAAPADIRASLNHYRTTFLPVESCRPGWRLSGLDLPPTQSAKIIYTVLMTAHSFAINISCMPDQSLQIEEHAGSRDGICIFRLSGPLSLTNVFAFQAKLRADQSRGLILDFTEVPLADSAGIGALVGAYVSRQKDGRTLGLVGVNQRIHQALEVTRVHSFFHFFGTVAEAEKAAA